MAIAAVMDDRDLAHRSLLLYENSEAARAQLWVATTSRVARGTAPPAMRHALNRSALACTPSGRSARALRPLGAEEESATLSCRSRWSRASRRGSARRQARTDRGLGPW